MTWVAVRLLCMLALAIPVLSAAVAQESQKIEPRLQNALDTMSPDDEVAIIIDFLGGVDVAQYGSQDPGKRSEMIKALRAEADRIQEPVASMLEQSGITGAKQLWMVNQMAVNVPASMVDALAGQADVEQIKLDAVTPLTLATAGAADPPSVSAANTASSVEEAQPAGAGAVLPPPTGLRGTATTQTIALEWDVPAEGGVVAYRLYERFPINRPRARWQPKVEVIEATATVVTDLEPGSRHEYAVTAVDEEGRESEQSTSIVVATLRSPTAYHPIHRSNHAIVAIAGNVFKYNVDADGVPEPTFSLLAGPDTMNVNPASGVVEWTPADGDEGPASATVRATNSEGTDDHTFSVTVLPAGTDLEPPSSVRMVVTRDTSTNGATLKWKPATDNVSVVGYRVLAQRFGRGNRLFLAGETVAPETSYTVTTLKAGTGYRLWIQPYDAAGNAATISGVPPAHITTLPGPPESAVQAP